MRPTWARELGLVSSGIVSRAGPSGAAPQADGGGAVAKPQEEDEAHLVGELWLMSSGTVSGSGPSGAAPQADGGGSSQAPGGG